MSKCYANRWNFGLMRPIGIAPDGAATPLRRSAPRGVSTPLTEAWDLRGIMLQSQVDGQRTAVLLFYRCG
jgi:hypothetical protein